MPKHKIDGKIFVLPIVVTFALMLVSVAVMLGRTDKQGYATLNAAPY